MRNKNILFILTDQWKADCFGFRGHKIVKTPNIDELAKKSYVFTNSRTVTPLCSPARGCLMTGLLPYQNGVVDNLNVGASNQKPLDDKHDTWLAQAVKNGYRTAYFGKWHADKKGIEFDTLRDAQELIQGGKPKQSHATEKGELRESILKNKVDGINYNSKRHEDKPPFYGLQEDETTMVDYKICQRAIEFLNTASGTPWCLTVSFSSPHFPNTVPEPYFSMYDCKDMDLPESIKDNFNNKPWFQNRNWWETMKTDWLTEEDWRKAIAAYYAHITFVDNLCGRVLDAAKANSGGRETICIFTADHGEMIGSHNRFDKGPYFYEEVMRIPLLLCRDINGDKSGGVRNEYCSTQDIAKTLFRAVGAEVNKGRDLFELINGTSEDEWEEVAFGVYHKYNGHSFEVRTITTPQYKYSYIPQDIDELYDLKNDPYELCNLSNCADYSKIKEELKGRLLEHMKENGDYLLDVLDEIPLAGTLNWQIKNIY